VFGILSQRKKIYTPLSEPVLTGRRDEFIASVA